MTTPTRMTGTLVVVGAGPRGAGLLERIAANLPEFPLALDIHFVDPHPPGAGRVWRHAQSRLLRMNSMAEDVTMFTDDSVRCVGPIRPGPSLAQWAATSDDPEVRALTGTTFASRQVQSRYLDWFFRTVRTELPDTVTVTVHATTATNVTDTHVELADGSSLRADIVVLAVGHLDADPNAEQRELLDYAHRNGLRYLPPEYSADSDLSVLRPGEHVLMRGFGLAFIDLMALLTEGRGGVFHEGPGGRLRYEPSGQEPVLYVGSRRGVPYHSKTNYRLLAERPALPRFFRPDVVDALPAGADFRGDVWPLIAKEVAWAYYHELIKGHPSRVRLDWPEFDRRFSALRWGDPRLTELIEQTVPAEEDRLDFDALDHPLADVRLPADEFQKYLREYIAADVARRCDQGFSADLGAFLGLLSVYGQLGRLTSLTARSQVEDFDGWWAGYFNYLASGPPEDRLRQLLALSEAGIVRFVGADMWVEAADGVFQAGGSTSPEVVTATALVEARLPRSTARTGLLRTLGAGEELLSDETLSLRTGLLRIRPEDSRVLDADGRPQPGRFALGPFTTGRAVAAFARPGTNAPAFRQNDAAARAVLAEFQKKS